MDEKTTIMNPDAFKPQEWASPVAATSDRTGMIFKVVDPASNYCGMIFKFNDATLKAYESEADGQTYIDYEYETDQAEGSLLNKHGALNFEKELNAWLLKVLRKEIMEAGDPEDVKRLGDADGS